MRNGIIAALASVCFTTGFATSANAAFVNFENRSPGDVVTELTLAADGIAATIDVMGGSNQAMVFDTENFTGGDDDLSYPGGGFGNVLIISEDGDSSDPDDNASGGMITFTFNEATRVNDFVILDIDLGETATFNFELEGGNSVFVSIPGSLIGNNGMGLFSDLVSAQTLDMLSNVVEFKITLSGSGAFDNFQFNVPLPAGLPLLLTGLAGLGLARRRRQTAN